MKAVFQAYLAIAEFSGRKNEQAVAGLNTAS